MSSRMRSAPSRTKPCAKDSTTRSRSFTRSSRTSAPICDRSTSSSFSLTTRSLCVTLSRLSSFKMVSLPIAPTPTPFPLDPLHSQCPTSKSQRRAPPSCRVVRSAVAAQSSNQSTTARGASTPS